MKKLYDITGMSCSACSSAVERAVKRVPGAERVEVSLLSASLAVEGEFDSEAIIEAVKGIGYGASEKTESRALGAKYAEDASRLLRRLLLSIILLLPVTYLAMGSMIGLPTPSGLVGARVSVSLQCVLTVAVMIINRKFFISAVKGLTKLNFNMDTLVSLGSLASFGVGVAGLLMTFTATTEEELHVAHGFTYFDSASMILALVTVGKFLEALSKKRTTSAIDGLIGLKPSRARVERNGEEVIIPLGELKVGDVFIVKAGESISTDGVILFGEGAVDESAITGENLPRDVKEGEGVIGSCLLESGYLKIKAERVGEDTTMSRIITAVENASASKAPVGRLADKISGIFVPFVMGVAVIVLLVWLFVNSFNFGHAVVFASSVLVISCPCALGLATPVAITVGVGRAAKEGILVRSAAALENAGKVTVVAFDKTGTVTEGKPVVAEALGEESHLPYVTAVERLSSHPLSLAIVRYAESGKVEAREAENFRQFYGGISGSSEGREYVIGSVSLMQSRGVALKRFAQVIERAKNEGGSVIIAETAGEAVLAFLITDTVRAEAKETIDGLKRMGIKTVMLTGDGKSSAEHVRACLGIDEVYYSLRPEDKANVLSTLKAKGEKVAFVGDGVNDAPALTSSDVGFALVGGTEVALGASDFVLTSGKLGKVGLSLTLSKRVMRIIKQNLFWAFIYNLICIPIAGGAFAPLGFTITPMIGSAAMSLSSVCVVLNSLRLYGGAKKLKAGRELEDVKACSGCLSETETDQTNEYRENKGDEPKEHNMRTFKVEGMMCMHCVGRVKKALEALGLDADVDLDTGLVKVRGDAGDEAVVSAIVDAGYEVTKA